MERFRPFIGLAVNRARLDDAKIHEEANLVPRYLPEAFEEFDEMEFLAPFEKEKKLVVSMALEKGKIMRILLGWIAPEDPEDAMRSLDPQGIQQALELRGEDLRHFLEKITS